MDALFLAAVGSLQAVRVPGGVPVAWIGALSGTGLALLAIGLVLVGAGAALLWLLLSLMAQNGRLLDRLEAAEAALRRPEPDRGTGAVEARGEFGAGDLPAMAPVGEEPAGGDEPCARCLAECEGRGGGAACASVCRLAGHCA